MTNLVRRRKMRRIAWRLMCVTLWGMLLLTIGTLVIELADLESQGVFRNLAECRGKLGEK